jgi:hypothetical protein
MKTLTKTEIDGTLAGKVFFLLMEAPSGSLTDFMARYQSLTGIDTFSLTTNPDKADFFLYLSEADYITGLASHLRLTYSDRSADQTQTAPNLPLLLAYDAPIESEMFLIVYSEFRGDGYRHRIGKVGRGNHADLIGD